MGKIKIEGEDIENLGLTLVGEDSDDDTADLDDVDALLVEDLDDNAIVDVSTALPAVPDMPSDHITVADDLEDDLHSQLEALLSPNRSSHTDESEDAPVSTRKSARKKNDDGEEEDDSLGTVQPRQKDETHCSRCYILVKTTISRCPVDDDGCPVVWAGKK